MVTEFEKHLLKVVSSLYQTQAGLVSTRQIGDETGIPDRTVRYYLARLERDGFLERPDGPKSGWRTVPGPRRILKKAPNDWLLSRILDWVKKLTANGCPVPTWAIAERVHRAITTVFLYLAELENGGLVSRPRGPKSGWMLAQHAGSLV